MSDLKKLLPDEYREFRRSMVFEDLAEKVKDMVQREKDRFFDPEFTEPTEHQKLRVMHYNEFWNKVNLIIIHNSAKEQRKK